MPPKKRITLPDHVRAAILEDVALTHEEALQADERDKIRMFLATEQGLTTHEIADYLNVAQTTVSRWSRDGKQARDQRRRDRTDGPGELRANGG